MLPFESSSEFIPLTVREIEDLFYKLEFYDPSQISNAVSEIARKIPWTYSISEIVDRLKDPTLRSIGRKYIEDIEIERTFHCMSKIADSSSPYNYDNLEQAAFLLSTIYDPFNNYSDFRRQLDSLSEKVNVLYEVNSAILTEEIKLLLLSRVLYQEEGYMGNRMDYNNVGNSYLSNLFKTKLGIPISLSVLQLLVGKRLDLPLYGANFPLHFMLYYQSSKFSIFIDPFNGGSLLDRDTCIKFLRANGFNDFPETFLKPTVKAIIKRMVTNLINTYRNSGNIIMEEIFSKHLNILQ